jgi:2'-5' RNA ligase
MARLRTFIAIDPGKAVRDRLVGLQQALARAGTEVKWVEPANLHVTLLFLGEVDERDVVDLCRAVSTCCSSRGGFRLAIERVGCFPNPRRPRVVWVGAGSGAQDVVALHDALEPPLLDLGCYRREDRPYKPHITLGRVRGDRPTEGLAAALARHAGWQSGTADVNEVLVLSSELTPTGPVYTVLSRARLSSESDRRSDRSDDGECQTEETHC